MAKARRSEKAPAFNEYESPLYRLFSRKDSHGKPVISEFQFAAGERLRADYERAHFAAPITSSWEGERTSGRGYRHHQRQPHCRAVRRRHRCPKAGSQRL